MRKALLLLLVLVPFHTRAAETELPPGMLSQFNHPNPRGHQLAADRLAKLLVR